MPFFILSIILQVALVLHIVKTGRNTTWIWIVVMLPFAGSIAYLIVEVLPGVMGSRSGRHAARKISRVVNPNKELNKALENFEVLDSIENSMRLADEFLNKQMFSEAKQLYEKCLKGVHKTDPVIMHGLAQSEFGLGNFQTTKDILDNLISLNPEFKNPEAHLLYAKALESLGEIDAAAHEYEALCQYYSGPEAKYRYAMLCKNQGKREIADKLLADILLSARRSGRHYNMLYGEWIKKAKIETQN
jgi:hypothetical protein